MASFLCRPVVEYTVTETVRLNENRCLNKVMIETSSKIFTYDIFYCGLKLVYFKGPLKTSQTTTVLLILENSYFKCTFPLVLV